MDVISDVLTHIPVIGHTTGLMDLHGTWAFETPESDHAVFHLVSSGSMIVRFEHQTIRLSEGDIIVFPRGNAHTIASAPGIPVISTTERDKSIRFVQSSDRVVFDIIEFTPGPSITSLISGRFAFGRSAKTHLSGRFPNFILLRKTHDETSLWLGPMIRRIAEQARSKSPGAIAALNGLFKMLFVQLMRSWLDDAPDGSLGWMEALRDPHIGEAIRLMHTAPSRNWSVRDLASEVGMSRSGFAARFAQTTNESPLRYLTRWRMVLAARSLETEIARPIIDVALSVGYLSEASFSVAFKRQFSKPPSAWRTDHTPTLKTNSKIA